MEVNFSLTIVLLVFAAKNVFADTKSPFAQQPQHYSVVQTSKNFPVDLQYPVQQAINEVDSNEPAQNQAKQNSQSLAYDPNAYTLSDPIHQYVSGPNNAQNGNGGSTAASGIVPTYSAFENFGPYVYNTPGAFAVQSGYEGYLVPGSADASQSVATVEPEDRVSNLFSGIATAFRSPLTLVTTLSRAFGVVFGLLGVTMMGGGMSYGACYLTGLCSFSFAPLVPLLSKAFNPKYWLENYLDSNKRLLDEANEKYEKMQDEIKEPTAADTESNKIEEN